MLLHNYFPSWPQNGLHLWFLAIIRTKHCAAYHRLQFFNHSLSCRSEVGPLVTWGAGTWWTDRTDSLTVLVRLLHQNSAFTDILIGFPLSMINCSIWDAVLEHVESNITRGSYSWLKEKEPVPIEKDVLPTPRYSPGTPGAQWACTVVTPGGSTSNRPSSWSVWTHLPKEPCSI